MNNVARCSGHLRTMTSATGRLSGGVHFCKGCQPGLKKISYLTTQLAARGMAMFDELCWMFSFSVDANLSFLTF